MKRLYAMLTVLALSFVLAAQPAAAAGFPDVPDTSRFHDEMNYLVEQDIISGYSDGNFQPKKNVTRGEVAIMIGRMLKLDGTQRNTKFKDVSKNHGASGYIHSAWDRGHLSGFADGTFRPDTPISRGDMAMILSRIFWSQAGTTGEFSDVGYNMKASYAIGTLAGSHVLTGYPDGTFRPAAYVTREQFSAFMARGLSIEFKQRTMKTDGYAYDLTKTYIYAKSQGEVQISYKKVHTKFGGNAFYGYLWEYKDTSDGSIEYIDQTEDKDGLYMVFPIPHGSKELAYPVKVNYKWQPGMDMLESNTITGVNKTVSTPYKTFTNAVEVSNSSGQKRYYVKGIGEVKVVGKTGETVSELKSIQ